MIKTFNYNKKLKTLTLIFLKKRIKVCNVNGLLNVKKIIETLTQNFRKKLTR